jgi:hypothetical protein
VLQIVYGVGAEAERVRTGDVVVAEHGVAGQRSVNARETGQRVVNGQRLVNGQRGQRSTVNAWSTVNVWSTWSTVLHGTCESCMSLAWHLACVHVLTSACMLVGHAWSLHGEWIGCG